MLVRGPSLTASMSHYLIAQIEANPLIEVRTCTEVVGADGTEHLEKLTLRDRNSGAEETVEASWLFVFIGAAPRTEWLDGVVARDGRGFVLTGPDLPGGPNGGAPRDGKWTGIRSTWRRPCPGSSPSAMSGPSRSSASPPRSVRARWP